MLDGQQKPALVVSEGACSPLEQLRSGGLQLRQFNRLLGHVGEMVGEQILDGFTVRLQELCNRAPVTGEVGDKRLAYGIRDGARCLKMHDVEEIPRVLSVQGGTELAGVAVRRVEALDFDEEFVGILRGRAQFARDPRHQGPQVRVTTARTPRPRPVITMVTTVNEPTTQMTVTTRTAVALSMMEATSPTTCRRTTQATKGNDHDRTGYLAEISG